MKLLLKQAPDTWIELGDAVTVEMEEVAGFSASLVYLGGAVIGVDVQPVPARPAIVAKNIGDHERVVELPQGLPDPIEPLFAPPVEAPAQQPQQPVAPEPEPVGR